MTETEKLAGVVVAAVKAATAPLVVRLAALEARAPVNGRDGADGAKGQDGKDGLDAPVVDLAPLVGRLAALEARALVPEPIEEAVIVESLASALRREFAFDVQQPAVRQRMLVDRAGALQYRIVDAPGGRR